MCIIVQTDEICIFHLHDAGTLYCDRLLLAGLRAQRKFQAKARFPF